MNVGDTTRPVTSLDAVTYRRARSRGRRISLLGVALFVYGLLGITIFAFVATAINRPLERVRELSQAVEVQRTALVRSMQEAEDTIRQMSTAVRNMDTSLSDAKVATDRSSGIAQGVSASMYSLRDQMYVTIPIINTQPFIGLVPSFDQAGQQLELLSQDLATIGTSLDTNRADVVTTSANLADLADSLAMLTRAVQSGPTVELTVETIDTLRTAIFAIAGWVVLFAVGCVAVGLYLVWTGWRSGKERLAY